MDCLPSAAFAASTSPEAGFATRPDAFLRSLNLADKMHVGKTAGGESGRLSPMASIVVSHSGLCVSDIDVSLRFYTEGLGFEMAEGYDVGDEVADTLEVPKGVVLRSQMIVKDGTKIELLGWKSPATHGEPSATRNQLGLTHLSFTVEDMPAVEEKLVSLGATVIESTRTHIDMGPASLDLLFLADPDGTRIELMETIIK